MAEIIGASLASVDGPCFSGKTTLVNDLALLGHPIIQEHDIYAGGGSNFPVFPPASLSEARNSIDFFLEIEKHRTQDALKLAARTDQCPVSDRSFYSCLFFQHAVSVLMPNIPNAYEYGLVQCQKAVSNGEIILPSFLIYLHPANIETLQERISARGLVSIAFMNLWETFKEMDTWFTNLMVEKYDSHDSLSLVSVNGNQAFLAKTVHEFIKTADYTYQIAK